MFQDIAEIGISRAVVIQRKCHTSDSHALHGIPENLLIHGRLRHLKVDLVIRDSIFIHDSIQHLADVLLHTLYNRKVDFYEVDPLFPDLLARHHLTDSAENKFTDL